MSKETKIEFLLDKYNAKRAELDKEYDNRMDNHTTNEAGEVSASVTLECNMWFTEEDNKLTKWFIDELKKIFNEIEEGVNA